MKTNDKATQIALLIELMAIYLETDRAAHFNISYELEKKIVDIIKNL